MEKKVKWLAEAESDLRAIEEYLVEAFGVKSALDFADRIDETLQVLTKMPRLGFLLKSIPETRILVIHEHTKLIYTIETSFLVIIAFADSRMDIQID